MNSVIELNNLGFYYIKDKWIFKNYNVNIKKGSITAILGPNGKGKTTLLKTILNLEKPKEGKIIVNGQISFVPQLFQTTFSYRVLDMVVMGRAKQIGLFSTPSKEDENLAIEALKKFNLEDFAYKSFSQLSGGQRQLVIIARALVANAQILILDEPTSALDLKNQMIVLEWINKLSREGLTIIFTTHHPHHALHIANKTLLMLDSENYKFDNTKEVLIEENLYKLYEVPMKHIKFEYKGKIKESLVVVV